jgi:hypothetical protein
VEKVLDQNNKLQKDKKKGLVYESGMAGPTVPETEAEAATPANKKKSYYHAIWQGHQMTKSMNCLFSTNEKASGTRKIPPSIWRVSLFCTCTCSNVFVVQHA